MYRFSFVGATIEDGDQFIDKSFIVLNDIKINKNHLLCTFYHELGHIKLNHLKGYTGQERAEAMARGEVYYAELEADKFAFDIMGKSKTIRWLESNVRYLEDHVIAREEYDQLHGLAKQAKKGLEKYRTSHMEIIKRLVAMKKLL